MLNISTHGLPLIQWLQTLTCLSRGLANTTRKKTLSRTLPEKPVSRASGVSPPVYDCLVNLAKWPPKFLMSLIQLKFEGELNLGGQ